MSSPNQAVILCGGKGTRLNLNLKNKILKPLTKIKKKEILLRVIEIYLKMGVTEIILLGGYKFDDLVKFTSKINKKLNIKIVAIYSGLNTETAGRLLYVKNQLNQNFYLTYGDSLASFDYKKLSKLKNNKNFVSLHYKYTLPYGLIKLDGINNISKFYEKKLKFPINAGFYLFDERIYQYIKFKTDSLERDVIPKILDKKKIKFKTLEANFWLPMDNNYDKKMMIDKINLLK